jgi:tetratricopeptide (TPR) repeat protein
LALTTTTVRTGAAPADSEDEVRRAEALELGSEGLALFEQAEYAEALQRFERANELRPAPTLGIRAARCLAKLGRLVEASERYLTVTRFPLGGNAQRVQIEAVRQARRELDELTQLMPTLTVKVGGAAADELVVEVDDVELPAALVGHPQPVDPGKHRVVVRAPGIAVDERPTIAAGERVTLLVHGPHREGVGALPQAPRPAYREWAIGGFAVGAAGVLLGTINGAVAVAQNDALEERCPERNCPPSAYDDADQYDTARALTTTGFVIGGLGLAVGAVLLWFDLSAAEAAPATREPGPWGRIRVVPTAEGLAVRF